MSIEGIGRVQIVRWRADGVTIADAARRMPGPLHGLRPAEIAADAVVCWAFSDTPGGPPAPFVPAVRVTERVEEARTVRDSLPMVNLRLLIPNDAWTHYLEACGNLPPVISRGAKIKRKTIDPYTLAGLVWKHCTEAFGVGVPDTISASFGPEEARRILSGLRVTA